MTRTRRELLAGAVGSADVAALQHTLVAQQLSLAAYERLLATPSIHSAGPGVRRVLEAILAQDRAHVAATSAAVRRRGGVVDEPPTRLADLDRELARHDIFERPGQIGGAHFALELLLAVERVAVGAAYTALASARDPSVSLLLAQAMASDAQHASVVHLLIHPDQVGAAMPLGIVQGLS